MSFPESLLAELATEKQLTERETEVFLALFGQGKTRIEIAERLHVQETAVSTCLSGIYRKFGISSKGPVKESRLKDELKRREALWQNQQRAKSPSTPFPTHSSQSMDALIAQVREHCRQKILSLHSRMRLLSGEEIGVDQLYVDVWLLNRSPRTYQVSEDKLLKTFDLRNDRIGLGDRIKRNPGFDVANENAKLVILGKPGSGKTTFLKHLAVDWCKGQFQSDLIAVFIEFRHIRDGKWELLDDIGKELGLDEGYQIRLLKQEIEQLKQKIPKSSEEKQQKDNETKTLQEQLETLALQILLKEGKLLVLMDGLDEVPTNALRNNVQKQLREMAKQYANNRWILTCRTQIIASIPDGFASVEVADFSSKQVQQFVQNWFRASGQSDAEVSQQWENFDNTASRNPAVKELTVTPVLLSLICLVFHDEGEMPFQMTDLYKKGIRLLLEKWNYTKAIEDWEVGSDTYRQLSVEQKEALLIEIAARKFENPKNFVLFEQNEIAAQIAQFLHLANHQEGVAVLKAMEAQHGLLIERADELWSFSHLTFQEHFTVQWLTQLPPTQLAEKITNQRWQEVVEQLVKSQQPGDRLLRLIKQSIDRSISGEPTLNRFLTWVLQKASSIRSNYKPTALRAFYSDAELACALDRALACALDSTLDRILALDDYLACALTCALNLDHYLDQYFCHRLDDHYNFFYRPFPPSLLSDSTLDRALDLDRILGYALDRAHVLALNRTRILALACVLALDCTRILALDRALALGYELAVKLEQLKTKLPSSESSWQFCEWWRTEGQLWLADLRQIMIQYRNIGHDWQFTDQQKQQLQRYHDANCFLVKLMQIKGAVSQEVRAEIEDSLLLPWDELQRRYPETYGFNSPSTHPPT